MANIKMKELDQNISLIPLNQFLDQLVDKNESNSSVNRKTCQCGISYQVNAFSNEMAPKDIIFGPAALPGSLARQTCPAALPVSLARQPCPEVLPCSLARQPCPVVLPCSLARQPYPATLPGSIARQPGPAA
jgi:hypothetical protein